MSRFFRQADDSESESEESEEELMSSGDEAPQVRPAAPAAATKPLGMARFLRRSSGTSSSSDSDDDEDEDEDESDEEEADKEKEVKNAGTGSATLVCLWTRRPSLSNSYSK